MNPEDGGTAEIVMSPEVRAALGAEGVARLQEIPMTGGHCPVCQGSLPPAGPVTVLVVQSPHVINAAFAHPHCAASCVIPLAADADAMGDADADMTVIAALVDHHGAYLPTLVAELSGSAYVAREPLAAGGDLTNVIVSTLLERDFTLVTNLRRAPRPAAGWVATLAESVGKWSGLEVTIRGDVFYVGTVHLPPGWTEAVERFGWCVVYAGAFRAVDSPGGTLRTLRAAAAAGGLAGGRMPVVWRTT